MKYYIHTIPKAGTYLIAQFMENMGIDNTGFHISQEEYLDTKKFSLKENSEIPSSTEKYENFISVLRRLKDNQMAFGHLPVPVMSWNFPAYYFICSYRHPKKTLLSEFIDFRFRRKDIPFVSKEEVESDQEAFILYLHNHGPIHMRIFSGLIAAATLFNGKIFSRYPAEKAIFINFDDFLNSSAPAMDIVQQFGLDTTRCERAWQEALNSETKTKATDLKIDRDAFWTEDALKALEDLDCQAFLSQARNAGLVL